MDDLSPFPKMGSSSLDVLKGPFSRKLFGHEAAFIEDGSCFTFDFETRLDFLIRNPANHLPLCKLGYASLEAFLQSNVTGPPLDFAPEDVVFPKRYHASVADLRRHMCASLTVQAEAIYSLIPYIELFWVARTILSNDGLCEGFVGLRARTRVNFWHQKLFSESSDFLRDQIYQDAEILERKLTSRLTFRDATAKSHLIEFLVEKAVINIYYGHDIKARTCLAKAAKMRGFKFALTGVLGKRTKFQDRNISQLVVLATSCGEEIESPTSKKGTRTDPTTKSSQSSIADASSQKEGHGEPISPENEVEKRKQSPTKAPLWQPENILLNDDTLLESIHFAEPKLLPEVISDDTDLPPSLINLNPSSQPLLHPLDSIILLQIASSISNTSPSDGLTREETLPYAIRVLEGGSSNWQVYTQALLVRSRIEGHRSRTAERGLLQLQALVDQVIVETATAEESSAPKAENATPDKLEIGSPNSTAQQKPPSRPSSLCTPGPSTFLPVARPSESAPVSERLKHVYQLHPPFRWELEAELAARWVSMGGLKTALEIYERLQMHAEVALCLAATHNDAKAIRVTRKLLFQAASGTSGEDQDSTGPELDLLPPDAPRLFCILGDLENFPQHYERAWAISKGRYPRAQRSLGRYYVRKKNSALAAEAYKKALKVNRRNASTWFALGCVQLELENFGGAVESFTRTVQLEADDAEAWSNLAAALIRLPETGKAEGETREISETLPPGDAEEIINEHENSNSSPTSERAHGSLGSRKEALLALRRAAQLKRDDPRIWDNYLTVAASIPPPNTPWNEVIQAQKRLITIRGKRVGEKAVDDKILTALVRYATQEVEHPKSKPGRRPASVDELQGEEATGVGGAVVAGSAHAHAHPEGEEYEQTEQLLPRGSIGRQLIDLMDNDVAPVITTSATLYLLLADLNRWRHRPLAALDAHEKAWRCVTSRSGIYERGESEWQDVVDATVRLVHAYEELGGKDREVFGRSGEDKGQQPVVATDWRFKAASAVRGVMGKGRGMWEGTQGWERLVEVAGRLKEVRG
jgi:tetratricopeptide (TPR) repeat protein